MIRTGKKKPEDTRAVISEVNAIYLHVMVILTGPQKACKSRLLPYVWKHHPRSYSHTYRRPPKQNLNNLFTFRAADCDQNLIIEL
jgi:hypothetical protein